MFASFLKKVFFVCSVVLQLSKATSLHVGLLTMNANTLLLLFFFKPPPGGTSGSLACASANDESLK
jgi:hypothetical protein